MEKSITILIPTMNRSDFLIRLLKYYAETKFKGRIFVGDSSLFEHAEKTKKEIDKLKPVLDVKYFEFPNKNIATCMWEMTEKIQTQYAAIIPDDDFLIPNGIRECINFLNLHPEYGAAHGLGMIVRLASKGPYGAILSSGEYLQAICEEQSASERLVSHLSKYRAALFSVFRTPIWRKIWEASPNIEDTAFSAELLPGCLSVIFGKVGQVKVPFVVRQVHEERYDLPDVYDWITTQKWLSSWDKFRFNIADALYETDHVEQKNAEYIVKQALSSYLQQGLSSQFVKKVHSKKRGVFFNKIKELPYFSKFLPVYRIVKSIFQFHFIKGASNIDFFRQSEDFTVIQRCFQLK
jgi:glycosyltransferase domain-containing protein